MLSRATWILVCMLCVIAPAQTPMSIADVESVLANPADHGELAERLTSMELTQRVTPARLARWQAALKNTKAQTALQAIADLSEFLPLPAADMASAPPPDASAQHQMLARAADYSRSMLPRLPNFSAARITTRFEFASPDDLRGEQSALQMAQMSTAPLKHKLIARLARDYDIFRIDVHHGTVTYRDGAEVETPAPETRRHRRLSYPGLMSAGEFGSILKIVSEDAAAGVTTWDHWEQGPDKLLAVFRYSVPKKQSHFTVYTAPVLPGMGPQEHTPAYHGELAVDPDDGSLYRITVQADFDASDRGLGSQVAVDYAPVDLGGKTYVCPVHSVAVLTRHEVGDGKAPVLRRFVNDIAFSNYHLFRSESRMIVDTPAPK